MLDDYIGNMSEWVKIFFFDNDMSILVYKKRGVYILAKDIVHERRDNDFYKESMQILAYRTCAMYNGTTLRHNVKKKI